MTVNKFDVLKEMSKRNLDIRRFYLLLMLAGDVSGTIMIDVNLEKV